MSKRFLMPRGSFESLTNQFHFCVSFEFEFRRRVEQIYICLGRIKQFLSITKRNSEQICTKLIQKRIQRYVGTTNSGKESQSVACTQNSNR